MNHHYKDIRDRIAEEPEWFDEHAVPRYGAFSPKESANIYAKQVALVLIACQNCGRRFKVCFSACRLVIASGGDLWRAITERSIHYGDPPNIECCPAGPTMNSEPIAVLEAWERSDYGDWTRRGEFEVVLDDPPVGETNQGPTTG